MSIAFRCIACGTTTDVAEELAGRTIRCRECHEFGRVPLAQHKSQSPRPIPTPKVVNPRLPWQAVPVWGTFLILLVGLLAGLSWGAWCLYDRYYRQPRLAEMRALYKDWELATRQSAYAKSLSGQASKEVEESIRLANLAFPDGDGKWAQDFRRQGRDEDSYWAEKWRESLRRADQLDRQSRDRFGVPAAELPRLFAP